jgi:glycerol-3-phosphate O-acyltransferase
MEFDDLVLQRENEGKISSKVAHIIKGFHSNYKTTLEKNGGDTSHVTPIFKTYLEHILKQIAHPYIFEPYHKKITSPFDLYQFGLDFFGPLINPNGSKLLGKENIEKIKNQLEAGSNVILYSNHQTEADPQLISVLLNKEFPSIGKDMIFVAGARVVTDPIAVPMSLGRDLLCIYSKKHVDNPPELKEAKLQHNQKTMKKMVELLKEGGKCIYVAPSGGRDRSDPDGKVPISPFDPQSVEMFYLMSQQANTKAHFYPLALSTYDLLPPPNHVEREVGEERQTHYSPIGIAFGQEIDMNDYPDKNNSDKKARRASRANYLWSLVNTLYQDLKQT